MIILTALINSVKNVADLIKYEKDSWKSVDEKLTKNALKKWH